eukprot:TRINITY_DN1268_c0_g5_i1.p1 TRINITY_DN1268_c0_g5~~TRINITY_DN1268_c0_g5_i1.p1  ORF type:complete len:258 (+),score=31.43 TRINITY_DN1268_c0_g5_i1:31-774(+)
MGLKNEILFIVRQYLYENGLVETVSSLERETKIFFDLDHIKDLVFKQEFKTIADYTSAFLRLQNEDELQAERTLLSEINHFSKLELRTDQNTLIPEQLDQIYHSLSKSIKGVKSINTVMPSFESGRLRHILNKSFAFDRYFYCAARRAALLEPLRSGYCELEGDLSLFRDYCCCAHEKEILPSGFPLLSLSADILGQVIRYHLPNDGFKTLRTTCKALKSLLDSRFLQFGFRFSNKNIAKFDNELQA